MSLEPMVIYDWPSILVPSAETFRIDARTRSVARRSLAVSRWSDRALGRWVAKMTVPLNTPAKIRAMRALLAKLDGRSNGVRVGPCDGPNGALLPTRWPSASPSLTSAAVAGEAAIKIELGRTTGFSEGVYIGLAGYLHPVVQPHRSRQWRVSGLGPAQAAGGCGPVDHARSGEATMPYALDG